jgi:hypothetical protein
MPLLFVSVSFCIIAAMPPAGKANGKENRKSFVFLIFYMKLNEELNK